MIKYNFDEIISRKGSNCIKYDKVKEIYGSDDVLPMWIADMDFRTPDFIIEAIQKQLDNGILGYTFITDKWQTAIVSWLQRRYSWNIKREYIGFVGGIVPAIAFAIQCFSKPGDNILIQPPVYHPYFHVPEKLSRNIITNPLILEDGEYKIDFNDFEEKVAQCKIFLLCNPHNPGGRVWSREELSSLADICLKHNVMVVSDEIHCDMALKGYKHTPFASIGKHAEENSLTLMAASKTFNIAGLKSSYYIATNEKIRNRFGELLQESESDFAHMFACEAVAAAYDFGEEWLSQMLEYVEENIDYTEQYLKKYIPKIEIIRPQASYLIFLDARKLNLMQNELVDFFVNKARVGLNDGAMFGIEGTGFMRMNIGCPRATLTEALGRIKNAYETIK